MPEICVFVRNLDGTHSKSRTVNRVLLKETKQRKGKVSANRTSQLANESYHFAHNFRVHAIAQQHGPFETIP